MQIFRLSLLLATMLLAGFLVKGVAQAQEDWGLCPAGSTPVYAGGGTMCQCPDGSYAGLDSGCPETRPRYNYQPQVRYCDTGGTCRLDQTCCGDRCCNAGYYCSSYGCTPTGAVDCGTYYCNPGQKCARNRNGCFSNDVVDCGEYSCQLGQRCASGLRACLSEEDTQCGNHICSAGYFCGSKNACLAEGTNDCGNGQSCPSDKKCSRDGKRCLDKDIVDCKDFFCREGSKCGSGKQCLASDAVDCGRGRSCEAGYVCRKTGGCATREELAAEKAAEEERKHEVAAQKAREAEER